MYLANHTKPDCPLFPVLISRGVTKVRHMYSIVLAKWSERSAKDNMDDGGEFVPKMNKHVCYLGIFWLQERRNVTNACPMQVMPNSGGYF